MKPTFKQVTKTRYVEQIAQLAEEIFVQHYTKLTPKVARALAQTYQSDLLTDEQIHSGAINYFLVYLGSEAVGYFALDLSPAGAVCLSRLFLLEKARGQGIRSEERRVGKGVDLGGRRIIKKSVFFKQKTAYEIFA